MEPDQILQTRMLDIISDYCVAQDYETCRIDGGMGVEDREEMLVEFSKRKCTIFLALSSVLFRVI